MVLHMHIDRMITITLILTQVRPNSVKIHGVKYSCIFIRIKSTKDNGIPFTYATIQDIYVYEDQKLFQANPLHIQVFLDTTKSYIVSPTADVVMVTIHDFFCHGVLHVKSNNLNTQSPC